MIRRALALSLTLSGLLAVAPSSAAPPVTRSRTAQKVSGASETLGWYGRHLRQSPRSFIRQQLTLLKRGSKPMLDGFIQRAFGGDRARYDQFVARLRADLPPGTRVAVWGSAATGRKFLGGGSFDARGRGTSDLDIVILGGSALKRWTASHFMIPKIVSWPTSDAYPDIAPSLTQTRRDLQQLAGRPVTLQAMRRWYVAGTMQPFVELK